MSGTVTVAGSSGSISLSVTSNDALAFANSLAQQINASIGSGSYTSFNYTTGSGSLAPSALNGVVTFTQPTINDANGNPISVLIPGADVAFFDAASGPLSVQGGAPGEMVVAGAGLAGSPRNLTYTNITPSGSATDQIAALGGNNLIQTSTVGGGKYVVSTGNGNDTINILTGNSTVNAGTGFNQVNLGSGNSYLYSEGFDTITGSASGGGTDTVNIGSGQTSINSGTSSFLVQDSSPNPLLVTLGFGVDTVNLTGSDVATFKGISSGATVTGSGTVVATDTANGDGYTLSGGLNVTVAAAGASETVNGTGVTGSAVFKAGSGNDTLFAGSGPTTLTGGIGGAANALLVSGSGPTTFSFVNGVGGGSDTISGLKSSDFISFSGFGSNPQGSAITSGANTIITLSDGTTVQVNGATPSSSQFKIS